MYAKSTARVGYRVPANMDVLHGGVDKSLMSNR
jgi:hypothetical protein